jgi:hypothetical protein
MSSSGSGGEHDSTGLRAELKLITPLSRCASPENIRAVSVASETTQQIGKWGAAWLPIFLRCCDSLPSHGGDDDDGRRDACARVCRAMWHGSKVNEDYRSWLVEQPLMEQSGSAEQKVPELQTRAK